MKVIYNLILITFFVLAEISCGPNGKQGGESHTSTALIVSAQAQMTKPVKWIFSVNKISETEAELVLSADIKKDWHMFSIHQPTEDGGIPLKIEFEKSTNYKLAGEIIEPKPKEEFDEGAEVKIRIFYNQVTFKQKVQLLTQGSFTIKGTLNGQACAESCVLIDSSFEFKIEGKKGATANTVPENPKKDSNAVKKTVDTSAAATKTNSSDPGKLSADCGDWASGDFVADNSIWGIFIAGFIGGLLALLTPCVFPMIPMTVSFFTKQSDSKRKGIMNALIYAASIIVIYVLLGMLVTVTLGSDALNDMSTNGFFNLAFFFIFIIFAISFFGTFEIVLPSSLVNKVDRASDRGGLIGIFFMAFTLSLVSFSCTGPIIGTLLVEAAHGRSYLGPVTGMTGFATALALPFALFAAFPGWLNSLPKSGGWLNSVKVCLGFVELALALKFLSNVDLAYHWGVITREIFISLWAIVFGLMGFYLLGKLRFSHDSEVKHLSSSRLIFALLTLTFTLYMIPGIWGAPLKLLSGILPPEYYKEWKEKNATDCPHDLSCFHDYDEGMAFAKAQGKPVFIDFTGYNCANCRKMEDNIWVDPRVLKRLSDDYVLISLYVDDKAKLPEEKQYVSKFSGKKIVTCGNKWSDMQAEHYNSNTQPMYVLIDNKEVQLAKPWKGYENAPDKYVKFLDEGLCRYKKGNSN